MNRKQIVLSHPRLAKLIKRLRAAAGSAYMRLCHRAGGADGSVFFSSFVGKAYSDSPRYICEALIAQKPDAKIVWQLAAGAAGCDRLPKGVAVVRPHSLAALRASARASVIVDDFNRPVYMPKFKDQYYIQTWHGDRPIKKILFDMKDNRVDFAERRTMDLAIAGSGAGERMYRGAFRYDGEILTCGMPRNDILLHPDAELIRRTRQTLGIGDGIRVLLYAPTFRDANRARQMVANIDIPRALQALERATGAKWICLARGHASNTGIVAEGAKDVSGYPEMAELLLISDLLITDYSSCVTDFMLLNRPLLLFQPDRDAYERQDREFYFDLDASPFPIATTAEQLIELLGDPASLAERCPKLREFFEVRESGDSARRIASIIEEKL